MTFFQNTVNHLPWLKRQCTKCASIWRQSLVSPKISGFRMNASSWPNFLIKTLSNAEFALETSFRPVSLACCCLSLCLFISVLFKLATCSACTFNPCVVIYHLENNFFLCNMQNFRKLFLFYFQIFHLFEKLYLFHPSHDKKVA